MPGAGGLAMRTAGLAQLTRTLNTIVDAAQHAEGQWWVGTVVVYSSFLEFGTARMPAKPFFQPAVLKVGRDLDNVTPKTIGEDPKSGRSLWGLMVSDSADGTLARTVAFALEREVKQQIKAKGLIDTGNLRASIVAAPSLPRMKAESLEKLPSQIVVETEDGGTRTVDRDEIVELAA